MAKEVRALTSFVFEPVETVIESDPHKINHMEALQIAAIDES